MIQDQVIIGMDSHKSSNTIVVMIPDETILTRRRFVNSDDGFIEMLDAVTDYPDRVWAVEGALLAVPTGAEPTTEQATNRLAPLSPAERVVAEVVAEGRTNREIGESLYVSRRTVETHIAHAFQKLDVNHALSSRRSS